MKREQEPRKALIQAGADLRNEFLARGNQGVKRSLINRHANEFLLECLPDILQSRLQDFVCRAIVAEDVGEESLKERVVDASISKQVLHVKQVPRMLTIKCRNHLAGIEIGKRNHLKFGEPKSIFGGWMHSPQINRMNRSSKDRIDFNLDLRRPLTTYESGSVGGNIFGDNAAGHSFTDALGNARKCSSDSKKRGFAILDGQVNQIEIHGEPGEISDKEIDCRATLQGKAGPCSPRSLVAQHHSELPRPFTGSCIKHFLSIKHLSE